jgi:lauroyl/myristoyl acyltransferase
MNLLIYWTAAALVADIMRDVNRAFENAVRRDPANWFWVHRKWK